jgi:seryl-tRNA synthetase
MLACGSINLHGNFFGKRFGFTCANGEPAQTGCVGLGIERWVLAAFTQHGFDERRWPEAIRNRIFS